jgi:pseudoazurin
MTTMTKRQFVGATMGAFAGLTLAPAVRAESIMHVVEMLNTAPNSKERQVFHPAVAKIAVGDTITFAATEKGHNSQSNKDVMPEGASEWKGKISKDVRVTFDVPGVYAYHCTPHRAAGMVGLILVGDVTKEEIEAVMDAKHRGKAKKRYEEYVAVAIEMLDAA